MTGEEGLQLLPGFLAPAVLLADILGDLAGADSLEQRGKCGPQALPLMRDFRADQEKEAHDQG